MYKEEKLPSLTNLVAGQSKQHGLSLLARVPWLHHNTVRKEKGHQPPAEAAKRGNWPALARAMLIPPEDEPTITSLPCAGPQLLKVPPPLNITPMDNKAPAQDPLKDSTQTTPRPQPRTPLKPPHKPPAAVKLRTRGPGGGGGQRRTALLVPCDARVVSGEHTSHSTHPRPPPSTPMLPATQAGIHAGCRAPVPTSSWVL